MRSGTSVSIDRPSSAVVAAGSKVPTTLPLSHPLSLTLIGPPTCSLVQRARSEIHLSDAIVRSVARGAYHELSRAVKAYRFEDSIREPPDDSLAGDFGVANASTPATGPECAESRANGAKCHTANIYSHRWRGEEEQPGIARGEERVWMELATRIPKVLPGELRLCSVIHEIFVEFVRKAIQERSVTLVGSLSDSPSRMDDHYRRSPR
jgi:hypothetical protein